MTSTDFAHGWFKVAFTRELSKPLTAATVGAHRLVLVRDAGGIRAFNADCPHRGAHLAYGGKLRDSHIVCPFHGYKIGLNGRTDCDFNAREYALAHVGGMVFVRLTDRHDNGLPELLRALEADHTIIPGFELAVAAPPEAIIENVFDRRHFSSVHDVKAGSLTIEAASSGALVAESVFTVPPTARFVAPEGSDAVPLAFRAVTVSPGLAVVSLSGSSGYTVITGATPSAGGACVIRLSVALPHAEWGRTPHPRDYAFILERSREGLEEDREVWEHLSRASELHLTADDGPIERFYEFCRPFRAQTNTEYGLSSSSDSGLLRSPSATGTS